MAWDQKAPFGKWDKDREGMLHRGYYYSSSVYKEVPPFYATMRIEGYVRGKFSSYYTLRDINTDIWYPMFSSDMLLLLQTVTIIQGQTDMPYFWKPRKIGNTFGIQLDMDQFDIQS